MDETASEMAILELLLERMDSEEIEKLIVAQLKTISLRSIAHHKRATDEEKARLMRLGTKALTQWNRMSRTMTEAWENQDSTTMIACLSFFETRVAKLVGLMATAMPGASTVDASEAMVKVQGLLDSFQLEDA